MNDIENKVGMQRSEIRRKTRFAKLRPVLLTYTAIRPVNLRLSSVSVNSLKELRCSMARIILFIILGVLASSQIWPAVPDVPGSGTTLNDILAHTRKSVGTFWGQFRSVTCVERVTQEKLGKQGKVEYTQKSAYDYLVLLNAENDGLVVEESRLEQGRKGKSKNIPLLNASGLPTLLLVFHPYYQDDFRYQLQGDELEGGHRVVKIGFAHVPGTRSTTALRLRGEDYPLDLQGVAWVDPETGAIHRIVAGLASPMSDHNLKALTMEVRYDPHTFRFVEGVHWLPSTATIDIQTERQHWRNVHQYSQYKRFAVNTEDRISR
jgi:hypothetical protein